MHSVCACCRVGRAPAPAFLAPSFFSSDSRCIARRLPEAAFRSFSLVPQSHTIELTRGAQVPHLRFVQIWLDANADFGVIAATTSTFSCGPRSKRATYPTAYSAFERPLLAARRAHKYASLSLCFKTLQEESVYLCGQSREGAHSWLPAATANGVSDNEVSAIIMTHSDTSHLAPVPTQRVPSQRHARHRPLSLGCTSARAALTVYQAIDLRGSTGQPRAPYS